jgi:hypothetical protein
MSYYNSITILLQSNEHEHYMSFYNSTYCCIIQVLTMSIMLLRWSREITLHMSVIPLTYYGICAQYLLLTIGFVLFVFKLLLSSLNQNSTLHLEKRNRIHYTNLIISTTPLSYPLIMDLKKIFSNHKVFSSPQWPPKIPPRLIQNRFVSFPEYRSHHLRYYLPI